MAPNSLAVYSRSSPQHSGEFQNCHQGFVQTSSFQSGYCFHSKRHSKAERLFPISDQLIKCCRAQESQPSWINFTSEAISTYDLWWSSYYMNSSRASLHLNLHENISGGGEHSGEVKMTWETREAALTSGSSTVCGKCRARNTSELCVIARAQILSQHSGGTVEHRERNSAPGLIM